MATRPEWPCRAKQMAFKKFLAGVGQAHSLYSYDPVLQSYSNGPSMATRHNGADLTNRTRENASHGRVRVEFIQNSHTGDSTLPSWDRYLLRS